MAQLQRRLGTAALTFYGVGMILGAGVYSVIGAAAGRAGEALWLSFLAGAAIALLTGLSYAELATMHPRTGAEHLYLSEAFPKRPSLAFLAGILLVISACATAATVALAFGGYLEQLVPVPPLAAALVLLVAASAVNLVGIMQAAWITAAFTLIETAGLVLVIALAARSDTFGQALTPEFGAGAGAGGASVGGIVAGAGLLFFAYLGFEQIAGLAAEAREPGRSLPRAILLSVAITTILYVLVGLAVVALARPETLAASHAPLAAAVQEASRPAAKALGVIALFATANTALATLVAVSRLLHGMAGTGALPRVLGKVLPGRKTPWVGALVGLALAALLTLPGDVPAIASLSSFGALLGFAAVNACVIALRRREPRAKRPFRVPLAVGRVPLPAAAGLLACVALALSFDARTLLAGSAALGLAGIAWFIRGRWASSRRA